MLQFMKGRYAIVICIAIALLLNFLLSFIKFNIDLTADKRYTLTKPTVQLLTGLHTPVHIKIFLAGDLPLKYKKLQEDCADLLNEFAYETKNNLVYEFVDLNSLKLDDSSRFYLYDSLSRLGIPFEQKSAVVSKNDKNIFLFPGALISVEGKQPVAIDLRSSKVIFKPFNIIDDEPQIDERATTNAASALLEYKFANAIEKLTRTIIPTVAYCVGNGEPIDLSVNDLGESLRFDYNLRIVDLKKSYPNPQQVNLLLIVRPTETFTNEEKIKIDQYLMHGGKIFWAIDKLYASMDSLMRAQSDFVAYDRGLDLDDILFKYGIRINGDLVQDLDCAKIPLVVGYNPDNTPIIQKLPWPYDPFLYGNDHNPISNNLDRIVGIFPSSLDTVKNDAIHKTILLCTDTNSRSLSSPAMVSLNSVRTEADFKTFNNSYIPISILLEGYFHSLYALSLTPTEKLDFQANSGMSFLNKSESPTQQIVTSNAQLFLNVVSQTTGPLPMGTLLLDNYRFANRDFLLNAVDYLTSSTHLFIARNRTIKLRALNKNKINLERSFWEFITIVSPLLFFIVMATLMYIIRKERFGKKMG
ncbi:MAG: gliding motility-associated ABC transporter substrate-binding protein GldG [Phycisphaerales bacterium]|nr:gliding motility-associated ABC transporter substrate-binding protein GldG [Phycisphaerales bacterium]